MNVDATVVVGTSPGAVIDEDGVAAPAEACSIPAVYAEGRADGDGWAEADSGGDDESGTGGVEDHRRSVDGDVIVGGVDGLDFEIAAVVDYVVVGVGCKIAVVVREPPLTLDGVHDVASLNEDGVAETTCPLRIGGHHVQNGGKGQEGEDAGAQGRLSAWMACARASPFRLECCWAQASASAICCQKVEAVRTWARSGSGYRAMR